MPKFRMNFDSLVFIQKSELYPLQNCAFHFILKPLTDQINDDILKFEFYNIDVSACHHHQCDLNKDLCKK